MSTSKTGLLSPSPSLKAVIAPTSVDTHANRGGRIIVVLVFEYSQVGHTVHGDDNAQKASRLLSSYFVVIAKGRRGNRGQEENVSNPCDVEVERTANNELGSVFGSHGWPEPAFP